MLHDVNIYIYILHDVTWDAVGTLHTLHDITCCASKYALHDCFPVLPYIVATALHALHSLHAPNCSTFYWIQLNNITKLHHVILHDAAL